MPSQIRLVLLSEAGGVGKTTIAVNLAYEWALRKKSVAIIDLDSNHSLDNFVGLKGELKPQQTSARIFDKDFDGDYPLKTIFDSNSISVCQGSQALKEVAENLVSRKRREYTLDKAFKSYPLTQELIILDCRAGLDLMSQNALAASTHILIPIDMGAKARTLASLINNIWQETEELELEPAPKILGLLPNHYNKGASYHEELIQILNTKAELLNIKLYKPLRTWQHLNNASILGQALKNVRPGDPMNKIFSTLANDLEKLNYG
jgi:chromosome partitioning protein